MNELKEALIAARKNVDSPEKWIKGALKGKNNTRCVVGAVYQVNPIASLHYRIMNILSKIAGNNSLADWNDAEERTHQDILNLFDKAIAIADTYE